GCSDLFDAATLVDYSFDISADEWAKIDYEFRNRDALKAAGIDYKPYHPIVFHYGGETVTEAMVRLKGDSSWVITVRDDGDKAKMQFVVSFEEVNPAGKFHGVSKIVLDMPNSDPTFLQERLGFTPMAEIFGLPAPCANSARVTINGQYYGLYVNDEHVGGGYISRRVPERPAGSLWWVSRRARPATYGRARVSPRPTRRCRTTPRSTRSGPPTTSRRCRPWSTCSI